MAIGDIPVHPLPLRHGRLSILGFRFGDFAYMTDVSAIPGETWPLLQGVRTVLIDGLRFAPHPTHMSVPEAVEVGERLGVGRLWLTHMSHQIDVQTVRRHLPSWAAPAATGTPPRWSPAPPTCGGHVLATEIAETWRCGRKPRHLVCTTDGTTVAARTVEVEGGCLVAELRSDRPPSGAGPLAELRSLAGSGHVFVTGIAPDAPFRRLLRRAGFRLVQRAERMARALAPASATSDGP